MSAPASCGEEPKSSNWTRRTPVDHVIAGEYKSRLVGEVRWPSSSALLALTSIVQTIHRTTRHHKSSQVMPSRSVVRVRLAGRNVVVSCVHRGCPAARCHRSPRLLGGKRACQPIFTRRIRTKSTEVQYAWSLVRHDALIATSLPLASRSASLHSISKQSKHWKRGDSAEFSFLTFLIPKTTRLILLILKIRPALSGMRGEAILKVVITKSFL